MTVYDFDKQYDRKGTSCFKYDAARLLRKDEGLLPLWVADMDFPTAQPVIDALRQRAEEGIFGYEFTSPECFAAIQNWMLEKHHWETDWKWIVHTPGVVFALAAAVRAYTQPGEAVLVSTPVYYPFMSDVDLNDRKLVKSSLVQIDDTYRIDFADLEQKIIDNDVKLYLLCNPHNPVGRAWTKEELSELARICSKHGVIVVSDEIHQDFARPGHAHTVFATVSDEAAQNCIVCTAPSKTFNLAGLQISNVFIPSKELRKRYKAELSRLGYHEGNTMGLVATRAAYEAGSDWLEQLKAYLELNQAYVKDFLQHNIPALKLVEPESTYLLWIDCRELGFTDDELTELIEKKAKLWLDMGTMFGEEGSGFIRVNIACPRSTLEQALTQLADAVRSYTV